MKTIHINLLLSLLLTTTFVQAQKINYQFGKVSQKEVEMTTYQPDTSAVAVILSKIGYSDFEFANYNFHPSSTFEYRIKILKQKGTSYADVSIPYYYSKDPTRIRENIRKIEAAVYNMENGKVTKSKLDKKYIFEEESDENKWRVKFSIPNVKAGSVIEYRYTLTSSHYSYLDTWKTQYNIPIDHSEYEVYIPTYYAFKQEAKGYEHINTEQTEISRNNVVVEGGQNYNFSIPYKKFVYTTNQIPALKDEPFLWCKDDYATSIDFELYSVQFPGQLIKNFSSTWTDVNKLLSEDGKFGDLLKIKNPLPKIDVSTLSSEDKIMALFTQLKQSVKWNEKYHLLGSDISKTIKEGTGSNADINFILMSMLREAGFKTSPVLMSERDHGRLPITHPSINKLTTFVVAVYTPEGKTYYLDGSVEYGYLNILPSNLMVEKAIAYNIDNINFVDLSQIGSSVTKENISATIGIDGTLTGKNVINYQGQSAAHFKDAYANAKDSMTYVEEKEKQENIEISKFSVKNAKELGFFSNVEYDFTQKLSTDGNHIYLNPMIIANETKNTFTSSERKLPIEFPYKQTIQINTTVQIPDGYVIEEIPEPLNATLTNKGITASYKVQLIGNTIQTSYEFNLSQLTYPAGTYQELRSFWAQLVDKNNSQIVLKRK